MRLDVYKDCQRCLFATHIFFLLSGHLPYVKSMLEFGLKPVLRTIGKRNAKAVAIQIPEGMKPRAWEIARGIEQRAGVKAIVFTDPCFGACDVAGQRAKALGADLLLHFAHPVMLKCAGRKAVYVPVKYAVSEKQLVLAAGKLSLLLKNSGVKSAALCAATQYTHLLKPLAAELAKRPAKGFVGGPACGLATGTAGTSANGPVGGKVKALIGKGDARIAEPGQVLGCNFSAVKAVEKKADAVVFVGDGEFHPLGISYITKKPLFTLDPVVGSAKKFLDADRDVFIRKRFAAITVAKEMQKFAVVVSTKPGQMGMKKARYAQELLEKGGKEALLMACDMLRPDYFDGMGVEVIVSTACPRIAVDDSALFRQPVLSVPELEVMLGIRKLGDYAIG